MHHAGEVIEEGSHHRGQHQREDQETGQDRQRHADKIDLHLRHQPRQHAEPDVEDEAEHQKRRGELQADLEGRRERPGGKRCDIAARHALARRKDLVAVVQRGDHEMVAVGGKQQGHAEQSEEVADQHALLALGRIDRGDETEPDLLRDHGARDLQCRQRHARGGPEQDADEDFVHHQRQHRGDRAHVDMIVGAVQRQDDQREQKRDRELDAHGDVGLPQPRQQHHHRADAGEGEHEGGSEHRQQRDIDAHLSQRPLSEVRDPSRHPLSRTSESLGAGRLIIPVPLFDLKSLGRTCSMQCSDFRSAALAH